MNVRMYIGLQMVVRKCRSRHDSNSKVTALCMLCTYIHTYVCTIKVNVNFNFDLGRSHNSVPRCGVLTFGGE